MKREKSTGRIPWAFMVFYALFFMGNSSYLNLLPIYLQERGFDATLRGLLLSVGPLVAMFAQPVWGILADRAKWKNTILLLLIAGMGLVAPFLRLPGGFWYYLIGFALLYLFQTSVNPLTDAITLEYLSTRQPPFEFGHIRVMGTIFYILVSLVIGSLVGTRTENIFLVYTVLIVLLWIVAWRLDKVPGHQARGRQVSLLALFKDRRFVVLLGYALVLLTTLGFYYSFFPSHLSAMGASSNLIGWSAAIAASLEIPYLYCVRRLLNRTGIPKLMVISGAITALRWLLVSFISNPALLLCTQLLHFNSLVAFSYCLANYVQLNVAPELKASGQTAVGVISFGLSRVLGSFLGGLGVNAWGTPRMFLLCAVLLGASTLLFCLYMKGREKHDPA